MFSNATDVAANQVAAGTASSSVNAEEADVALFAQELANAVAARDPAKSKDAMAEAMERFMVETFYSRFNKGRCH